MALYWRSAKVEMTMYLPPKILKLPDSHIAKAQKRFGDERVRGSSDTKLLFVCFTNRSGSNYLSEAIASSGDLNAAGEYFNSTVMEKQSRSRGVTTFGDYLQFLNKRTGSKKRFCSKIGITQFALLDRYGVLDQPGRDPHFLFIERRDLLGQAISWQIASQTQSWKASDTGIKPAGNVEFSSSDISRRINNIAMQNYLWRVLFAENKIPFFHVIYEDFAEAPQETLAKIAAWLNIDGAFDLSKVRLTQQRSSINKDWRDRYSRTA